MAGIDREKPRVFFCDGRGYLATLYHLAGVAIEIGDIKRRLDKSLDSLFNVFLADDSDEVVLTPVRRSIRKTPQKQRSTLKNTPVVTTPKIISEDGPGLRLTPDNVSLPNDELTVIGTGMEAEETREEATRVETSEEDAGGIGMDLKMKEDEMECDPEQQEDAFVTILTPMKQSKQNGKLHFVLY